MASLCSSILFLFVPTLGVILTLWYSFYECRSAEDQITGEVVAIKLVTRVTERIPLSKRALREIMLLRHFASHENITGLIDVDASSPNLEEMWALILNDSFSR